MKKKNKDIEDALWKLEEVSEDEKIRRMTWLREKWALDEASAKQYWKKKGLEQGREEGKEQGLVEGREQGIEQEKVKITKEMLKNGIDLEIIEKCTGLTREEIKKMQN